ncbi:MAG: AAA family ATPase, partial [Planctomycetaceae bacterium]|nr:AAA family ATPase [Planctomycetaceae bacterium]
NKNETVFIVEGEKCCDILVKWERCVTTGSGGVNTAADWVKYLSGRDVVILPDNDEAGYKYALKTAQSLQGKAVSVRVLFLPNLNEKEDIYDWIKKGNTKKQFSDLVANTPIWDGKSFAYKNELDSENTNEPDKSVTPKLGNQIEYRKFSDIPQEKVEYLLQDIIPLSTVTVFVGDAGDGKSYFSTWLSASVTKPGCFFRGQPIPNGKVIICNTEDHAGNTIGPRLALNGANMEQVIEVPAIMRTIRTKSGVIESYRDNITFDNIHDVRTMLEDHPTCKVVIFDPLTAFWGEINENKNAEVRVAMSHLKRIAEDHKAAIVLVTHFNKAPSCQAMSRITGSLALPAASRAVWSITNDPKTNIRTVACIKNNLSENREGFTFKIVEGQINVLDEYVDVTADEMLQERMLNQQNKRGPEPEKMNECCDWLRGILAFGSVSAAEIFEKAIVAGYSKNTVNRAKKMLEIEPKKEHFSGRWMWSFSQDIQANSSTKNNLGIFEDTQVISGVSENLGIFEQSLENKGVENGKLLENSQDTQVLPIYKENLGILGENTSKSTNSTVETHCENNGNNATKTHAPSTIIKNCGKPKKSPESGDMIITTTVEEAQERVDQIIESKQERLERINRQKEENLKKVKLGAK